MADFVDRIFHKTSDASGIMLLMMLRMSLIVLLDFLAVKRVVLNDSMMGLRIASIRVGMRRDMIMMTISWGDLTIFRAEKRLREPVAVVGSGI